VIFGIGTDIVDCARIEAMWSRYGDRFASRVLSVQESSDYRACHNASRFLAKRFAAKEAFAKAVGSGLREPVSLFRISISHDELGKPVLKFDEVLHSYLSQLGVTRQHLSISDERNTVIAFVVLETD